MLSGEKLFEYGIFLCSRGKEPNTFRKELFHNEYYFNVISGEVIIGDNTIFGHNCMLLTGTHNFYNGRLASLNDPPEVKTPIQGRDILLAKVVSLVQNHNNRLFQLAVMS